MDEGRTTEATIDLAALRENVLLACRLSAGRELIGVVKADAYGHGAVAVARGLVEAGCQQIAVVSVEEAVVLREAGVAETAILILGGLRSPAEAREAAHRHLTPVLHDDETRSFAAEAGRLIDRPIPVHVEVDTGMSRMGAPPERAVDFLAEVEATPELDLRGAFTHFSRADEADLEPCMEQLATFRAVLGSARKRGARPTSIHVANSAGLLAGGPILDALPEATAVRPGLMLYGVRPAPHFDTPLRAGMCLQARVVRLQDVAAGQPVGYGATYRARATTQIATLPLGYADGVPCSTSGKGWVWLGGRRHPIVGRVSMDYIGVDVGPPSGANRVRLGDRAVIFGNAGDDEEGISVEEAAGWAGTIPYESLVRVGRRVQRREVGRRAV